MKKLPWGIFAGISAMVIFFVTVGIIAAFIILDNIAAQTMASATLFDQWYQVVLFVADVIFALAFVGSVTMYVLRVLDEKKNGGVKVEKSI